MGRKPSVNHLRIIGSRCVVLESPTQTADKLRPKGWEGILVGYAIGTIGYRVWCPTDRKVYQSKHVTVNELPSSSLPTEFAANAESPGIDGTEFAEFDWDANPQIPTEIAERTEEPEYLPQWTRFLSRPRGPDNVRTAQYVSDEGDIIRNLRAAEEYHRDRGLPFNANLFDFNVTRQTNGNNAQTNVSSRSGVASILFTNADPQTFRQAMDSPDV